MRTAFLTGIGLTAFGRLDARGPIELMTRAADLALADADLPSSAIDGLLIGYATTLPHLMLADVFAESYGIAPAYAHAVQAGGATGLAMVMLARELVRAGRCRNVLVAAGEDRLSGQPRDASIRTLAQVGHPEYELPFGATVPAYYALVASRYLHQYGASERDLAALAVLMRAHAAQHSGAHLRAPLTLDDALASRPIAAPLKLADCCPISDGACALVVSAAPAAGAHLALRGAGQAHRHQHVSLLEDVARTGARDAAHAAWREAGVDAGDIDHLAIYDSFTITLALQLEEIGFAPRGGAGALAAAGAFSPAGDRALNTHGGLLAYGHCGVAGGMAHLAEAALQLAGRAGARQARRASLAYVHGDGGVLSAHVGVVLERLR